MMLDKIRFELEGSSYQGTIILDIERLYLSNGLYYVDIGIYEKNWEYAYDYHWHVYPMEVTSSYVSKGILVPPHKWTWSDKSSSQMLIQLDIKNE